MAEIQKPLQNFVQKYLQKNGRDVDEVAEEMQRKEQTLYEDSTKLDAEKHGYDGLTWIIPATEGRSLSISSV